MTIYIIRCAITLTLLYSFYGLLLRRETFHRLNRAILLSILSLTTVLPLCRVETSRENILAQKVESITAENLDVLKIAGTTGGEMQIQARGPVEFSYEMSFPWGRILSTVYFAVVICLILRYLLSMFSLARLIRHSEHFERRGNIRILVNPNLKSSCSWMRWILLQRAPDTAADRMILCHEMAHVRLCHSLDLLLADLSTCFLWFHPFVWMLRRDLRDIHEFQADEWVLGEEASTQETYETLIIREAVGKAVIPVVHSFKNSTIKKRLTMMNTKKSNRNAALKALYLLPFVLLVVMAFAKTVSLKAQSFDDDDDFEPTHIQPVEVNQIETAMMTLDEYRMMPCPFYVENVGNETHVVFLVPVFDDRYEIGFSSSEIRLYDDQTGDCYVCREIKGYGENMFLRIKNYQNSVIPFTFVFPKLKPSVERIALTYAGNNIGRDVQNLREVMRKPHKVFY